MIKVAVCAVIVYGLFKLCGRLTTSLLQKHKRLREKYYYSLSEELLLEEIASIDQKCLVDQMAILCVSYSRCSKGSKMADALLKLADENERYRLKLQELAASAGGK